MTCPPQPQGQVGRYAGLAFLLAAVASAAACLPGKLVVACEEHLIDIYSRDYDSTVVYIPIAPNTATIPEFHDCQRLMVDGDFGPLAAIWAAEGLEDFFAADPSSTGDPQAFAVAQIFNYGYGNRPPMTGATSDERYPSLDLQAGFSCLYLWRDPRSPTGWEARMVFLSREVTISSCSGPKAISEVARAPRLSVRPTPFLESQGDTVPAVARWDRDRDDKASYIGIRCGQAWCEIGEDGFRPSIGHAEDLQLQLVGTTIEPDPVAGLDPAAAKRRVAIKGWYDQQELAILDDSGRLVPSGVLGTIIPHPVLDAIGRPGSAPTIGFAGRWVPSAYIHVTGTYDGKELPLEKGVTRLFTCEGTQAECEVDPSGLVGPVNSGGWWSKLVSPTGVTTYRSVVRDDHAGKPIPAGAARWRWLETDEKTWIRCSTGCCTVN